MLSLFEESPAAPEAMGAPTAPAPLPHLLRIVADSNDRVAWLRARSRGITATDVAKLSTLKSVRSAAFDKLNGSRYTGKGAYLEHGREREPVIAGWVLENHGIEPSTTLYHARGETRHLATPDGLAVRDGGRLELAEIKTTSKPWRSIPRHYLRQVWWQQYVLGAERTLVVWEHHEDFVPVGEPECRWVDRDDAEIGKLVGLADQLLSLITPRTSSTARRRFDAGI